MAPFLGATDILWATQKRQLHSAELHRLLGAVYCNVGKSFLAIEHFQQATNDSPNEPWILIDFGDCLARQEKWARAIRLFGEAMKMSRDYIPFYGLIDRTPMDWNQAQSALAWMRAVRTHLPADLQPTLDERIERLTMLQRR
jgi:tetratricopeptide (TPR) repeat protein